MMHLFSYYLPCFSAIYIPDSDVDFCPSGDDVATNSSIVSKALDEYCDCVPDWLDGMYFSPEATLVGAVAATLLYMCANQLTPLALLALRTAWSTATSAAGPLEQALLVGGLEIFSKVPAATQRVVVEALRESFPGMPNIQAAAGDAKEPSAGPLALAAPVPTPPKTYASKEWMVWRTRLLGSIEVTEEASLTDSEWEKKDKEIDALFAERPRLVAPASEAGGATTAPPGAGAEEGIEVGAEAFGDEAAEEPTGCDEAGPAAATDRNALDRALQPYAGLRWRQWYLGLTEEAKAAFQEDFFARAKAADDEAFEFGSQQDATVFFALNLAIGLAVLAEYFFNRKWPSGESWLCKPAFFTGVMMFKPLTIPLWSCLTLCCHYTFASQLFGSYRRDPATGTPYSSPILRNRATVAMVGTVAVLMLAWVLGAAPLALPLLAAFPPRSWFRASSRPLRQRLRPRLC